MFVKNYPKFDTIAEYWRKNDMTIPRKEHPNPQFERQNWENLNGIWEFEIDKSNSGKDRELYKAEKYGSEILVPFCPESSLSGIGETDFLNSVWYKRTICIKETDELVFLHIGACDYYTTVYVNCKEVGTHKGGYTSFAFDITDYVKAGENTVVINAQDDNRSGRQPRGKQSSLYYSNVCDYTRTTGIWQTVWVEYVPKKHIKNFKIYPDYANGKVTVRSLVTGSAELSVKVFYDNKEVGSAAVRNCGANADVTVELSEIHLWEVGNGRLYDLYLTYGKDEVKSYFGLRNVAIEGYNFMLNGKRVFQRTVLDQGYYPDGIYTAPTEEAIINDIQISIDAGFNGARLHQKIFEPRFLYHCDKMGYIVWGEHASWGLNHTDIAVLPTFLREWEEALERDFNHPAIIGWIPFNETWDINGRKQDDELIELVYKTTKALDNTRPCIDTSGGFHVKTDIFDFHDYEQDVDKFSKICDDLQNKGILNDQLERNPVQQGREIYNGEVSFASEYGGIKWDIENDNADSWGYGDAPKTEEEFIERYKGLTEALLKNDKIIGFCYTQLYDVEQEKNGIYTYGRKPKFDINLIKKINTQSETR